MSSTGSQTGPYEEHVDFFLFYPTLVSRELELEASSGISFIYKGSRSCGNRSRGKDKDEIHNCLSCADTKRKVPLPLI